MKPTVFTIGHSSLTIEQFIGLLGRHAIEAVADVRSSPYSGRYPQFNRELLEKDLRRAGIKYVFLGLELGARRSESGCYVDGRADYSLISQTPLFQQGIRRVVSGAAQIRIALMCAEREPLDCHRCILVAPQLRVAGVEVSHILGDGTLEPHEVTEQRLLRKFHREEMDLFAPARQRVAEAYQEQGLRIAFHEEELTTADAH